MESIVGYMEKYDYENLLLCQDKALNFKAIIALHDTTLGPAPLAGAECGSMKARWMP